MYLNDSFIGNGIDKGELEVICRVGGFDMWMYIRVVEFDIIFLKIVFVFSIKCRMEFYRMMLEEF